MFFSVFVFKKKQKLKIVIVSRHLAPLAYCLNDKQGMCCSIITHFRVLQWDWNLVGYPESFISFLFSWNGL